MINFSLNLPNSSITSQLYFRCTKPTGNIDALKKLVLNQYQQYPLVVKRSNLKKVNIVSNLKVKNNPSLKKYFKHALTVDAEMSWMYINIDFLEDEKYLTQCINHEIVHLYDYSFYGSFKPNIAKWTELNPKGFEYKQGGYLGYLLSFKNSFHPRDGFITEYATLGIDEDRAELFMYYFSKHLKAKLNQALAKDKILNAKLNLLLEEISN